MSETETQTVLASPSSGEASPGVGEPAEPRPRRIQELLRRLHGRVHWFAPNTVPAPWRDRAYEVQHDKESNETSGVPQDAKLRVRALWGIEVFGPNESDLLYEALKRLNWSGVRRGVDDGGALAWVRQQRSYGLGGYYNVGLVTRPGQQRRFLGSGNQGELPEGVDHLYVRIHQICPAVTCVVVCFVLEEEATKRYERELNLNRRSRYRRMAQWSIEQMNPIHIKQEAIEGQRSNTRRSAFRWFKRTIPGYFATAGLADRLPFAELMCTAGEDIFGSSSSASFDWRRILANPARHDIWMSRGETSLRFVFDRSLWPDERSNYLVAGVSLSSIQEETLRIYGGSNGAIVYACDRELEGLLPFVAVAAYVREVSRELKQAREGLRLSNSRRRTLRSIKNIQRFFDKTVGVPAAARELCKFVEKPGALKFHCGKFSALDLRNGKDDRDFSEELRFMLHRAASTLLEDESSTREHFDQLSSVLSIRESIGAQRRMEILTVVALLVAGLSLGTSWPERWDTKITSWGSEIRTLVETFRRAVER